MNKPIYTEENCSFSPFDRAALAQLIRKNAEMARSPVRLQILIGSSEESAPLMADGAAMTAKAE